jgi:hypothetical protein
MEKKMNKIKQFFYRYRTEINWFLMGWLTLSGLHSLAQGDYLGAAFSWGLAYINFKLI